MMRSSTTATRASTATTTAVTISVASEYVDDGLTVCYEFPDGSSYRLNMFPPRKRYVRRLVKVVGFQKVKTYGDFQESYEEDDPDFFIHVAEKTYES